MDGTDCLLGKSGYPMENLSKKTVPFNRTVTNGEDNIANFNDGGDSSDEENEFDWVEVVAMSCEDPIDENVGTRPQIKRKKRKNFIKEWKVNEDVQLAKSVEGNLFNASIESINQDGTVTIRFKDTELMMTSTNDNVSSEVSLSHESVEKDSQLTEETEETLDNSSSNLPIKRALFNHIVSVNTSIMNDTGHSLENERVKFAGENSANSDGVPEESRCQARATTVDGVLLLQSNQLSHCPFCRECHRDLSEHFAGEHANFVQVKRWLKKKKKKTKAWLLKKLQNMGNYRHNCDVIRTGAGKMIIGQPIPEDPNPSDFSPCPGCLGFFNRKWLLEHECVSKLRNDVNSRIILISDSKLLLPLSHEMTDSARSFVMQSAQEVGDTIANDSLLCELSHREFARFDLDEEKSAEVKSNILDLSKFLAQLNETISAGDDMQQFIDPDRSHQIVTGLKKFCESMNENGEAFVNMISSLRRCGVVLRAKALEDGNWLLHEKSLKFIDLCDSWMLEMTDGEGNQERLTQALTADIVRTFTEDVVLVWRYLCEVCTTHRELLEDADTSVSSSELRQHVFTFSKVVLAKVLLFNKEEEDCIAAMRLKDFQNRHPPKNGKVEDGTSLNWRDHLFNSLSSVSVKDETGTKKTILLTEDMVECINLLISKRDVAYISPGNKDVFTLALFNFQGNTITASDCVKEFSNSCGLVFHNLVICPMLSKALATAVQLTCLSRENSELVSNYLGDHGKEHEENMTLNKEILHILHLMRPLLDRGAFLSPTIDDRGHVSASENVQEGESQLEETSSPFSPKKRGITSKRKLLECNPSLGEEQENATEEQEDETNRKRKKIEQDSSQRAKKQKKTQKKVQKPRKPFVFQTSYKNGVRQWDKKYYCLFCGEPTAKLPRHLKNRHPSLPQVIEWMAETDLPKKLALLAKIRNMGNCKHNCQVLREGVGRLVVVKRPSTSTDPGQFAPCPDCYGFYARTHLWHHACPLSVNRKGDDGLRSPFIVYSKLLLPVNSASSQSVLTWLAFLKRNEVVEAFVEDWVICEFAQKDLAGKSLTTSRLHITKAKLNMLASVLLELREKSGNKKAELQDFIEPNRFSEVENAIKALTEYDEATSRYSKPHVAERMWQYVKMCSVLIRGTLLELGQLSRLESAWSFGKLCDPKILEASRQCPPRSGKSCSTQKGDSKDESDLTLDGNVNLEEWDVSGQDVDIDAIARLVDGDEMDGLVTCMDDQTQSVLQDGQETDKESDGDTQTGNAVKSKRRRQHSKKQFYSEEEKEAVWRHLGNAIKCNRTPGKMEVLKCKSQEPVLQKRTWSNIKYFCRNTSKSREKARLKNRATNNSVADRVTEELDPAQDKEEQEEEVETQLNNSEKVEENVEEEDDVEEEDRELTDGDTGNQSDVEVEGTKERLQTEEEDGNSLEDVEKERQETGEKREKRINSEEVEEMREKETADGESENIRDFEETSKDEDVPESVGVVTRDREVEMNLEERSQKYGLRKMRMRIKKVALNKEQYEDGDDSGREDEEEEVDNVRKGESVAGDDDDDWEPESKKQTHFDNGGGRSDEEYTPSHTTAWKGKKFKSKPRRISQKRPWSEDEKAAVYRHMEVFITTNTLPGKEDVMKCKLQEDVLNGRTWKNVKDFCRNAASARMRKAEANKEMSPVENIGPPSVEMEEVSKKRGPATPEEQEAIQKHFKLILRCGLLPNRKVIEKIMWREKLFDGRSWRQLREFCIKERKKLQSKRAKGILS